MATIPSIQVANVDAADVLEALERKWKAGAIALVGTAYETMTGPQRARECLRASIIAYTRNLRRERAVSVLDIDAT